MREKVGKFLKDNMITMPMYISLLCIGIWDSITALIVYAIIIHVLLLFFFIGLYNSSFVKLATNTEITTKNLLFTVIRTIVIITILAITEHWYLLCISIFCMFLIFVHLYDMKKDLLTE